MQLNDFSDFLAAAGAQDEPQQLLFVFAAAELPQTHSPGQKKRFDAGRGGALTPVMCVDKSAAELASFAALAEESRQTGQPWDMVFVAALPGRDGQPPGGQDVDRALKMMIDAVHRGAIDRFAAFDPDGQPVRFF
ncbi:hypothetical protein [Massilia alkalitolerans]|uniref:hypothetical protein n=1 Tax=Massilia alkalitolerans TaxID=286638 RepID=UPI0004005A91|nr:hypothetical protein [Massilia alkalitolerans]